MIGHKTSLGKLKEFEIIPSASFSHNGIKLEIDIKYNNICINKGFRRRERERQGRREEEGRLEGEKKEIGDLLPPSALCGVLGCMQQFTNNRF